MEILSVFTTHPPYKKVIYLYNLYEIWLITCQWHQRDRKKSLTGWFCLFVSFWRTKWSLHDLRVNKITDFKILIDDMQNLLSWNGRKQKNKLWLCSGRTGNSAWIQQQIPPNQLIYRTVSRSHFFSCASLVLFIYVQHEYGALQETLRSKKGQAWAFISCQNHLYLWQNLRILKRRIHM